MKTRYRIAASCAALLTAFAAALPAHAADVDMYDGQWHYNLTPYGWFPSMKGEFRFDLPNGASFSPVVEAHPSGYLKDLQFAGMIYGEARKGSYALWTDIVYADLSSLKSKVREVQGPGGAVSIPLNVDANMGLKALVWTAGGAYTLVREKVVKVDALAGVRYGDLDSSLDANGSGPAGIYGFSRGASVKAHLWDGIVGVQGNWTLDDAGRWYVPFEVDIGAGSNNWTWNGIVGIGYRMDWGSLVLAYRNLKFSMTDDGPVSNMSMYGPALGVTFRW
jgi:hypothetical protein